MGYPSQAVHRTTSLMEAGDAGVSALRIFQVSRSRSVTSTALLRPSAHAASRTCEAWCPDAGRRLRHWSAAPRCRARRERGRLARRVGGVLNVHVISLRFWCVNAYSASPRARPSPQSATTRVRRRLPPRCCAAWDNSGGPLEPAGSRSEWRKLANTLRASRLRRDRHSID